MDRNAKRDEWIDRVLLQHPRAWANVVGVAVAVIWIRAGLLTAALAFGACLAAVVCALSDDDA